MEQISILLTQKQAKYLYQSLTLTVFGLFFATSFLVVLLWELQQIRDQLTNWYLINVLILGLRLVFNRFYQRSSTDNNSQKWIYLYIFGACLNGTLLSLIIFLIPASQDIYYTYVLLLLGSISIASIASMGVIKIAFMTYITALSAPVIIFFITHINDPQSFHFYVYLFFFFPLVLLLVLIRA